ncbi:hypothetical protein ASF91_19545 [Rhizobium sp. Leaf155]|nr:hypothetical protein ASF91_19545 [Rhizobium sp. Leaf155]
MFGLFKRSKPEVRESLEDPKVPISQENVTVFLGVGDISATGERVTIQSALGVPPIFSAVTFMAGTLAALPLHLYEKTKDGQKKATGDLAALLHSNVNDGCTSFEWRKHLFEQVFSGGRSVTFIERNGNGKVINLWPLDPERVKVKRRSGRKFYEYRENGKTVIYEAADVIDIAFMLKANGVDHRSPLLTAKDTIGLAQAATKYGSKVFQNGGVPPFTITGPFKSAAGMARAAADMSAAVAKAASDRSLALAVPEGHKVEQLGADPEKTQFVELKRFLIEEIARIFSLPPVFLQDLSNGTFSNTEQQDLHFVKHTLTRWAKQFEQELNLKLFGRANKKYFVKLNLDGLLRGDYKTRMEGNARAIQSGQITPDEARETEDRPALGGAAAQLHMQGAMLPIEKLGQVKPTTPPKEEEKDGEGT